MKLTKRLNKEDFPFLVLQIENCRRFEQNICRLFMDTYCILLTLHAVQYRCPVPVKADTNKTYRLKETLCSRCCTFSLYCTYLKQGEW